MTTSLISAHKQVQAEREATALGETLVDVLNAGFASVDVQPLVTADGETTIVDWTEAQRLRVPPSGDIVKNKIKNLRLQGSLIPAQ